MESSPKQSLSTMRWWASSIGEIDLIDTDQLLVTINTGNTPPRETLILIYDDDVICLQRRVAQSGNTIKQSDNIGDRGK